MKILKEFYHHFRNKYNNILWNKTSSEFLGGLQLHKMEAYPFKDKIIKIKDPKILKSFKQFSQFKQKEYIVKISKKAFVEPKYGWVISEFNYLLTDSLPYATKLEIPSFNNYIKTRFLANKKIRKEKIIISLRDISEASYFHFYNDVLNKLILLENFNISKNIPLLISKKLFEKHFFQGALKRSNLKDRKWIIQDNFYIETDEIIYCKTMPHRKSYFDKLLNLLNVPEPNNNSIKRIFLTRNPNIGRCIKNYDQIKKVCNKFGFEIKDTENISLDEQIKLFSNARYIIGIHGAGLTNIIFRRNGKLSLLEIFPPDNIPPHYYWLASIFGFNYDAILGSNVPKDNLNKNLSKKPFYLDPKFLIDKLESLEKEKFF